MALSEVKDLALKAHKTLAKAPFARSKRLERSLRLRPRDDLIRLGSEYGGWTVPSRLISHDSICYCAGVGFDVSFDLGLIERFGCEVHAFDPTPSAAAYVAQTVDADNRFHFHRYGIWSEDRSMPFFEPRIGDQNYNVSDREGTGRSIAAEFRSVPSLMAELGHEHIDLLKLDIEGSEYEVIDSVLDDGIEIGTLCVEFHKTPGIGAMKRASNRLENAGLFPCHQDGFDVTFVRG
jgi:FkbM family methyltransferase